MDALDKVFACFCLFFGAEFLFRQYLIVRFSYQKQVVSWVNVVAFLATFGMFAEGCIDGET